MFDIPPISDAPPQPKPPRDPDAPKKIPMRIDQRRVHELIVEIKKAKKDINAIEKNKLAMPGSVDKHYELLKKPEDEMVLVKKTPYDGPYGPKKNKDK